MSGEDRHLTPVSGHMALTLGTLAKLVFPTVLILFLLDQQDFLSGELSRGQIVGRDAFNFWLAGRMAFEGHAAQIYDHVQFTAAARQVLGPEAGMYVFPYPPPALLALAWIGPLAYPAALALLSAIGLAAYLFAVCHPHWQRSTLVLALLAPPTLMNLGLGQNGLLSAALFIGGLRLMRQPAWAGILIGLLAYKPFLAALIPFVLLFQKHWTALLVASATVVLLCVLPALIWGPDIWIAYVSKAVPWQRTLLEQGQGGVHAPSAFIGWRAAGGSMASAYFVQALVSACALAIAVRHFWRSRHRKAPTGKDLAILALATILVTPYVHDYDFALVCAAMILLSEEDRRSRVSKPQLAALVAMWIIPLLTPLANLARLPVLPLLMLLSLLAWTRSTGAPEGPRSDHAGRDSDAAAG